jgi:hypothetical protein
MSRRSQRRSGTVTTEMPVSATGAFAIALAWVNMATVGWASVGKKKSRSATPRVTWKYTKPSVMELRRTRSSSIRVHSARE